MTATVIGATGLIGSYLVKILGKDEYFNNTRLLTRRPIDIQNEHVEVKLIDFNDAESLKLGIDGSDVVFCAIGTTKEKVEGDKEAYRKVDYDIPVKAAQFCKETGCKNFVLVSSVGADSSSGNFYLQLKGEVEDAIQQLNIESVTIVRPSILLGDRKETRPAETVGKIAMSILSFALIGKASKLKPIHAEDVAQAMVNAAKSKKPGLSIYEYKHIKELIT
jgi:uncharacterized protein YbjT (DUF2867 family)